MAWAIEQVSALYITSVFKLRIAAHVFTHISNYTVPRQASETSPWFGTAIAL
jgi:hypothetical protein